MLTVLVFYFVCIFSQKTHVVTSPPHDLAPSKHVMLINLPRPCMDSPYVRDSRGEYVVTPIEFSVWRIVHHYCTQSVAFDGAVPISLI